METVSEWRLHGGVQGVYSHASEATGTDMTFALFRPARPSGAVLWWLSGLTCTHENAMTKAGLQGPAAEAGLTVVYPDTSPRGEGVADADDWAMGQGAGFYVDATAEPWAPHFRMRSYVVDELPALVAGRWDTDPARQAVAGHSMGGHGALTLAMAAPGRFRSVSAFAPICNPSASEWGRPQLTAYGLDPAAHDATEMLRGGAALPPAMIDTGTSDQFGHLLGTGAFAAALAETGAEAQLAMRRGYDHSYWFVSTYAADHVAFHAGHLA
jgi:S-formylglutathione hydrolase